MDKLGTLEAEWSLCFKRLAASEYFRKLREGSLGLEHYKGFLRESYHNTRQNPLTMALFVAHIKSDNAALRAKFLKHSAMELGHDEMALDDLRVLGADVESIRGGRPAIATEAMSGFITFQIQHRNPVAHLGYSFHLETLPVRMGEMAMSALGKMGVPAGATSFLKEHVEADPVHNKWNREYVEGFVRSESDLEAVVYGMRGTSELHGSMFQGIIDAVAEADVSWSPTVRETQAK